MARKPRIEFPGAFFHVLARGNNRRKIFHSTWDYRLYLKLLRTYKEKYAFRMYAYVLMPNHVHFLIETGSVPLSKIMQGIQQCYAVYYHKQYQSVGHLFQSRYKAILCDKEVYFLRLLYYIHQNPVRAGITDSVEQYTWSSFRGVLRYDKNSLVDRDFVLSQFSEYKAESRRKFREFITDGEPGEDWPALESGVDPRIYGEADFVKARTGDIVSEEEFRESPRANLGPEAAMKLLCRVSQVSRVSEKEIRGLMRTETIATARGLFCYLAWAHAGLSQIEIARLIGRSPSSVSRMIVRIEHRLKDESFRLFAGRVMQLCKPDPQRDLV